MTGQSGGTPFVGFMDDYYAEAEDHIVAIRRGVLALEGPAAGESPAAILEQVFRSCHSLKGISAMVELREAELLAHHLESVLRGIRQGDVTLSPATIERLAEGANRLDEVIAAHRSGSPLPEVDAIVARLSDMGAIRGGRERPVHAAPTASGVAAGSAQRLRVTFMPAPELVARGVKIDTIRARLLDIGQVLSVTPRVVPGGGISFEFEVETSAVDRLAEWRADGVAFEPITASDAVAPALVPPAEESVVDAPAAERPQLVAGHGGANFVRVDLTRLDELMRFVGDLVVTRARLETVLDRVEPHVPFQDWRALQEQSAGLERQLRDLREAVMRVRLVPVGEIFRRMPFVVRDLARGTGKRVQLELAGQATEIDKFLIERMMDPVVHLVRNAISHGIEPPADRLAAGKGPEATIRLSALTSGESVILEVSDDGAGIDVAAVAARARRSGIPLPDGPLEGRALLDIICGSGFSTREVADRGSGRGVGMSVVRSTVEELGGLLAVDTAAGRGTTFRITLPLTLAITDAIIAQVGSATFAVPQSAVAEVIELEATALRAIEANELVPYRGGSLPVVRLASLFGLPLDTRSRFHAIVVGRGLAAFGLLVDRITGQREIVVKSIADPLLRVDGISGATELGDGRLVLILDVVALGRATRHQPLRHKGVSA